MIVNVKCRNLTPLFMNRMSMSVLEGLRTKVKKPKAANIGTALTPRQDAEPKVYVTADGKPYIPGENFMSCLIGAGCFVRLDAKRQISTAKATLLPGLMSLLTTHLLLVQPGTKKAATWEADVRKGTNPNGGEAVAICRPRFDAWEFSCTVDLDLNELGENAFREIFDKAGRRIGLGDFRPSRKGIFGQFVVDGWQRAEERVAAAE